MSYFYHRILKCGLLRIDIPNSYTIRFTLPDGHCTDMSGAIKLAKSIARPLQGFKLRLIETIGGGDEDTFYALDHDGHWQSRRIEKPRDERDGA